MNRPRAFVYGAVALIVGVSVVSGPTVGLVDLTTPRYDTTGLGQGNISVDRVDAPERVELAQGYQSESYRLEVPDARIRVAAISGRPIVAYELAIPALGYDRGTAHFLGDDDGWVTLSLSGDTLARDRVMQSTYNGTLSVVTRASGTETVVYRERVPVEVTS